MTEYETILVETRGPRRLDHPEPSRGAQRPEHAGDARRSWPRHPPSMPTRASARSCSPGSERAFAAGADIKEMESKSGLDMLMGDHFGGWARFAAVRTPVIAAVSGYALGGGCELAMMCDIILAADTAKFGQPEINLGVIPGMGGSQRLIRAVGYYKAAELVLTGRMMDAAEAERAGPRVAGRARRRPARRGREDRRDDRVEVAARRCTRRRRRWMPRWRRTLAEGLRFERHVFAALFDTADQKEGMAAFREKRAPDFTNR